MSHFGLLISVTASFLVQYTLSHGISRIDESRYRIRRQYNDSCPLVLSHQTVRLNLNPTGGFLISGIHLAATGESHSMRVSWTSRDICAPALVEVEGLLEGTLHFTASREEPYEMTISAYRSGYFFNTLLTGLRQATSYRYRVRCDDYWSNFFTFTTPPSHGDMSPVKIFILGDHGTRMEGMTTIKAMLEAHRQNSYDLVVHVGDLSYANGGFTEYIWDIWAEMVEPIAAQLPYMVTPGNHEILLSDSGGELGIPYMKRFTMPMEMQGSFSEYWYSWNYGQIHFVSVSSEHAHNISQQQWVADDLRSASLHRDKTPWFVMFGHHSIYTSNQRHGNQTELRKWLDPLLLTYDVDIAFWGHDHAYERSYPITNSAVVQTDYEDPKAPIHVTCGASGWDLHDCWQPDVAFSAFHTAHTWGYCTLHVKSPTVASVKFIDQNKVVIDSVHIKKNRIGRSLISDGIKEVNIPVSLVNYTTDRTEYVTSDATSSNTTMATTTDANVTTSRGADQTRLIPTESNQPTNILSNNTQEVAYAATSLKHTINSTAIPFQVSTKPTTTQLVPDKTTVRSDSVTSKSLKLSVVVAISSVAGLLLISVVYYLARRRRKKGNKYELLPLQNLSPSGSSDSEN